MTAYAPPPRECDRIPDHMAPPPPIGRHRAPLDWRGFQRGMVASLVTVLTMGTIALGIVASPAHAADNGGNFNPAAHLDTTQVTNR